MKKLIILPIIIFHLHVTAQTTGLSGKSVSVNGTITMGNIQSIEVTTSNGTPVSFTNAADYSNGVIVPAYYNITVVSNTPWVVAVKAPAPEFTSTNVHFDKMPVNVLELKGNVSSDFIPVSTVPQTLLMSDNNNIKNDFKIDARFLPGWNFASGQYNTTLEFTISTP